MLVHYPSSSNFQEFYCARLEYFFPYTHYNLRKVTPPELPKPVPETLLETAVDEQETNMESMAVKEESTEEIMQTAVVNRHLNDVIIMVCCRCCALK